MTPTGPSGVDEPKREFRVGCPMWAHRPWIGRWLPSETRPGTELAAYARVCNAVEGNTTWYAMPTADTIRRWGEMTPVGFRFACKLPREITHDRRLNDVAGPVRSFLDRVEPLAERIGPVQVQLPPTFGPEGLPVLASFARRLPRDWPWVIELRHPGWFDGGQTHRRLDELLIERGVGRVVLDTRSLYSAPAQSQAAVEERANKPRLPVVVDAVGSRPVVRVIGQDSAAGTMSGLRAWVPQVVEWLGQGREPYLFVHQPENLDSPDLARRIHAEVRAALSQVTPLPEPGPVEPQLRLL